MKRSELRQALFDVVAQHLLLQARKSVMDVVDPVKEVSWERPAYRGKNGAKCSIGILIDDDRYTPELEGNALTREPVQQAVLASGYAGNDAKALRSLLPLLQQLQDLHDCYKPESWSDQLHEIAAEFDLSSAILPPPSSSSPPRAG